MDKITFSQMYDYLSDVFEQVSWRTETCADVGNSLIRQIAFESTLSRQNKHRFAGDPDSCRASMLNALCTLVNHHNVVHLLDFSPLLPQISGFDGECTDSVLYLLSCTGDLQYEELIRQQAARFPAISAEEHLAELHANANQL